ncbi:GNAT family N-acetyltransferase [Patulibacter defluvii]|uniref:GNAT family N-acetyltransferase n=1 Tax=Patulibacter defluvii TaxID=3095358 RepID=UPI002A75E381|nr:GNAT family N-acetyltransferase [Patulibacter sp. DM4]
MPRVRAYDRADAAATLAVFRDAISGTASAHYTPAQIAAWLGPGIDPDAWHARRAAVDTLVAEADGQVVGFTDLDDRGHIDMLFVAPRAGRSGVATALLEEVLRRVAERGLTRLTVEASLSARPFFLRHGFAVLAEQQVARGGERLVNFRMARDLDPAPVRS